MPLIASPNTDNTEGLKKGSKYPILGFTSSTVLVLDDNGKLQHVAYAALNDDDRWSLADSDSKPVPEKKPATQTQQSGVSGQAGTQQSGTQS